LVAALAAKTSCFQLNHGFGTQIALVRFDDAVPDGLGPSQSAIRKSKFMENSKVKAIYVISSKGERKYWTKIGVAFVNRDGSLNCKLESLPVDGVLHIRDFVAQGDRERPAMRHMDGPKALVG
jgi:hypothetical protein